MTFNNSSKAYSIHAAMQLISRYLRNVSGQESGLLRGKMARNATNNTEAPAARACYSERMAGPILFHTFSLSLGRERSAQSERSAERGHNGFYQESAAASSHASRRKSSTKCLHCRMEKVLHTVQLSAYPVQTA